MKLWSDTIADGQPIPAANAFGRYNPDSNVELSGNRSPHLAWSDLPQGTESLVLLCVDPDVPSVGDDVNQPDKTVPADLPRVDFFHWVLVDLAADTENLADGEFSEGVTARGKDGPAGPRGSRQGINDYTGWFAGDADMTGQYFGYDGPCPPWNDARVHHYEFTLYALDVERCPVSGDAFGGADVRQAIEGHILAQATLTGTYHIYPDAKVHR